MYSRRVISVVLVIVVGVAPLLAVPAATAQQSVVANDIDGDGHGDLLVGVPLEGVAGMEKAGAVHAIFSDGTRLRPARNVVLTQGGALAGEIETEDLFGAAVELADVNGDGYADAVIGSSGQRHETAVNAGMFHVVYGSAAGLDVGTAIAYRQGGAGLPDEAEVDDFFGFDIASGDFDDDGYVDIAVTAPFESVGTAAQAGGVLVVYGSSDGLVTASGAMFTRAGPVAGRSAAFDTMGWSVDSGDFDGDGFDDLAVGVPGEDHRGRRNSGGVNVLYGSASGITAARDQRFSQAGAVGGRPSADDLFGFAVAAADLNCDGRDDLAVGAPNDGAAGVDPAGVVNVILGSPSGLRVAGDVLLHQGLARVAGDASFNQFGASLTGGDFDGDGCGDLAIGAPTTNVGGAGVLVCAADPDCAEEAGAVVVISGTRRWPRIRGSQEISQLGPVADSPEDGDFFGRTLAAVDTNGDGADELVVGVPGENFGGQRDAGILVVVGGSSRGLRPGTSYSLSQRGRIAGAPEAGDRFSSALFAGGS